MSISIRVVGYACDSDILSQELEWEVEDNVEEPNVYNTLEYLRTVYPSHQSFMQGFFDMSPNIQVEGPNPYFHGEDVLPGFQAPLPYVREVLF